MVFPTRDELLKIKMVPIESSEKKRKQLRKRLEYAAKYARYAERMEEQALEMDGKATEELLEKSARETVAIVLPELEKIIIDSQRRGHKSVNFDVDKVSVRAAKLIGDELTLMGYHCHLFEGYDVPTFSFWAWCCYGGSGKRRVEFHTIRWDIEIDPTSKYCSWCNKWHQRRDEHGSMTKTTTV